MPTVVENADTWSKFSLMSTNGAVRTYTSGTSTLITTNGVPTRLTYFVQVNGQQTEVVLTIHSYTDSAPAFTIFRLDSTCVEDGYTCENCYNSSRFYSPNFSFRATGATTTQTIIFNSYSVYSDVYRGLLKLEITSTVSGQQTNTTELFSRFDNVEFTTTNDQCTRTSAPRRGSLSSVLSSTDPWSTFTLMNIAGYVRTYTSGTYTLITTNGVPTSLTYFLPVNGQQTGVVLTIHSYTDSAPAFTIFQLDTACVEYGYICENCYNSPAPLSPEFSFRATGTTTQGQSITSYSYLVYNVGARGLLKLEFTTTVSGQQTTTNVLFSRFDNMEYTTTSDQCTRTSAPRQGSLSSVLSNEDPWSTFTLMNIVRDVRTYTSGTATLIMTNEVPTNLSYSVLVNGQPTQTTLTITSYFDHSSAFNVFQLDPACIAEGYACEYCSNVRSSAIGIANNFVYVISSLMVLFILI